MTTKGKCNASLSFLYLLSPDPSACLSLFRRKGNRYMAPSKYRSAISRVIASAAFPFSFPSCQTKWVFRQSPAKFLASRSIVAPFCGQRKKECPAENFLVLT